MQLGSQFPNRGPESGTIHGEVALDKVVLVTVPYVTLLFSNPVLKCFEFKNVYLMKTVHVE